MKRKRVNFRLRKIIVPKAPIMVLNEMVGAVGYMFAEAPNAPRMMMMHGPGGQPFKLFTAQCMVRVKFSPAKTFLPLVEEREFSVA